MDMKWKKLAAMGCIVTMTAVLTIGCGTTESTGSTSADSTEVTEEKESDAVTMQVTSVDGDTVTGDVGEMSAAPSGDQVPDNQQTSPEKQTLDGDIVVDDISSLDLTMDNDTTFTGTINASGDGGTVHVTLSDDSSWTLTGDSYVTSFDGDLTKVTANGYHLYVNGEQTL